MKEEFRKALESEWKKKNGNSRINYDEWASKREGDWRGVITKNRPNLTKTITNDARFYDLLLAKNIFNRRTLESFKIQSGRCAQISALLDGLTRRSFADFISFCCVLIEDDQAHIIASYLTPEIEVPEEPAFILVPMPDSTQYDAEVVLPAIPATYVSPVDFNWRQTIRRNFTQLMDIIDPDNGVLERLRAEGVISDWNSDLFELPLGRSNRVAKLLDYIMLKRPDEDFLKLRKILIETNQSNVVAKYLSAESLDRTDVPEVSQRAPTSFAPVENLTADIIPNWRDLLVKNRTELVDNIIVNDQLIGELIKHGIINVQFSEVLKEEKNVFSRADRLLDFIRRRSDDDFARFRMSLRSADQEHIVKDYLDINDRMSVPESGEQSIEELVRNGIVLEDISGFSRKTVQPEENRETSLKQYQFDNENANKAQNGEETLVSPTQETGAAGDLSMYHGINIRLNDQHERPVATACNPAAGEPANTPTVEPCCANTEQQPVCGSVTTEQRSEETEMQSITQTLVPVPDIPVASGPVEIVEVTVRPCLRQFYDAQKQHAYKMSKPTRGKCIIFNMENVGKYPKRLGTRVDGRLLTELFKQLHFDVKEIMNPTAQALKDKIIELSQDASLEHDECLVLFVMSHGTSRMVNNKKTDCIFGSDGQALTPDEILSPLTDISCRYLKNKPRLAFFQACRGDKFDATDSTSEPAPTTTETDYMPQDAPSYPDFLIGYPTQSSYRSFRNTERGSWYINSLVRIFMNCACSMDICAMLNKLNGEVSSWSSDTGEVQTSNKTQIANFVSHFRHPYFYFFPGINE